jgi:hypothetical protein
MNYATLSQYLRGNHADAREVWEQDSASDSVGGISGLEFHELVRLILRGSASNSSLSKTLLGVAEFTFLAWGFLGGAKMVMQGRSTRHHKTTLAE